MNAIDNLPVIRSSERRDYKRCVKKWYWTWRRGLVLRNKPLDALDFGTWMHSALAQWYQKGRIRNGHLADWFTYYADGAITKKQKDGELPDYLLDKAWELSAMGEAMAKAYEKKYGKDPGVYVIQAELPLEFSFSHPDRPNEIAAIHKFKPDLVFMDREGFIWLMEHKTATSIKIEHLVIDDQARPYGAMTAPALEKLGIVNRKHPFKGILYNFLRKAMPDQREQNAKGLYLNKDGRVSKKQPPMFFSRPPIKMTRVARAITLVRTQLETIEITELAQGIRNKQIDPRGLPKTPHHSCPKFCQFFSMCVVEDEGGNIRDMEKALFYRRNPYLYEEESTTETPTFEFG